MKRTRMMNEDKTFLPPASEQAQPLTLVIPSDTLFRFGRREVVILHDGQAYRLRLTRQNKLILTK